MDSTIAQASLCRQVEKLTKLTLPKPARCITALLAIMLLPLMPSPLVCEEDDARSTNADSRPAALVHAVCRAMKAHVSSDWLLPDSGTGGKGGKGNCGDDDAAAKV
jgi:hypothetical protein